MFTDIRVAVLLPAIIAVAAEKKVERTDYYGDPLPERAIARMGSVRGRIPDLVTACVYSPDGKMILAAGGGTAIHSFDATTRQPLRQLHQHEMTVTCLSFSPDGKMLVSGSKDGDLCLWNWPSGKVLRRFSAHKNGVRVLAFAGTGKFVASGGEDKRVRLWDVATGRELRQYQGHKDIVRALAVSPDGRFVASVSQGYSDSVHLWDAASGRLLQQHKKDVDWVQSLAFSPDSKLIAIPVNFFKIALWDVESGKIVRRFSGDLSGSISSVAFSPDGRIVAAAAANCSLILWDAATGKILHELPGRNYVRHPGGITCLAFSPDGRRLAFGEDHCLRVWDVVTWREVNPVKGHANPIYRIHFSRDSKTLATAADEPADALQEWDAATGKKLRTLWNQHLIGRHGFHLSPDHKVLTVAEIEEKGLLLRSQDTTTGKELRRVMLTFNGQWGYSPATIVLSPDGKIITSESRDNNGMLEPVLLRDTATGKAIGKLSGSYEEFLFAPNSETLACVEEKQIDLYNMPRGRIVGKLPLAGDEYNYWPPYLSFSLDSLLVVVASSHFHDSRSNRLDLWETTTGQKRAKLSTSRSDLMALAFTPDGVLLAAGDRAGVIHLWSLASDKEVQQMSGHRGGIESLTFSPNGKRLASGGWDATALIWDMREATAAARPQPTDVPRERLERLWTDLAGNDGERVHRAIWSLVAARQAMPWLRDHLKPVPPPNAQRIARLIADLDSDTFAVREKATRELEEMGETAESALRKVLADKPSLEVRRRIEPMVKDLEGWPVTSAAALRDWRALEVLEHLDTPEARQLLQQLAEGVPEARLTRAAKTALRRLTARDDNMP